MSLCSQGQSFGWKRQRRNTRLRMSRDGAASREKQHFCPEMGSDMGGFRKRLLAL
jgi:hypothetical protein